MINIYDLMRAEDLIEMTKGGYIRTQVHPLYPYNISCYTKQAMFERAWNDVTMNCRGLIWHQETGEILARPFKKFFNYGEPNAPEFSPGDWVTVFNKVDGSLGIAYETPEGPAIATKGSFTSDQAVKGTQLLRDLYPRYMSDEIHTDLFEIIYPENRIVLDYGNLEGLVYLGSVKIEDGSNYWNGLLMCCSGIPRNNHIACDEFEHVVAQLDLNRPNAEGVVILNDFTGDRIKIKQQDYIELHRVMTGLSEKQLWEWLSEGKTYDEVMSSIPEELHEWAKPILTNLVTRVDDIWDTLEGIYDRKPPYEVGYRKVFAEWATQWTPLYKACLFLLLDNNQKKASELIWKQVKP